MNLRGNKEGYTGGIRGKKGKGKFMNYILIFENRFVLLYFMCVSVLSGCMSVLHICAAPVWPEESTGTVCS